MTDRKTSSQALNYIRNCTMMDDRFMTAVLDDNIPATQLILRTVLGIPDLEVVEQHVQHRETNLRGRSSVLDVYAVDAVGTRYDIEVQNASSGATPRRARYNASLIDASSLEPGQDVERLPEVYVIFITRDDVIGGGEPVYVFDRVCGASGRSLEDGSHLVYVNGAHSDPTTQLGLLLEDMRCAQPDKMHFEELASRARDLKGGEEMDRRAPMLDDIYQAGVKDGMAQGSEAARAEGVAAGVAASVAALVESGAYGVDDAMEALKVPDKLCDAVRERVLALTRG